MILLYALYKRKIKDKIETHFYCKKSKEEITLVVVWRFQ